MIAKGFSALNSETGQILLKSFLIGEAAKYSDGLKPTLINHIFSIF